MKNTIVVYTAIFGGYEGLLPQKSLEGVDFVCFSDTPQKAKPWRVEQVAPPHADPTRNARERKILPHRFLREYDISIWIDGNYLIVGDIRMLVSKRLTDDTMLIFDHAQTSDDARGCVYDELDAILAMGKQSGNYKDDPETMRAQIERYRSEGYPAQNGLIYSSILIRRHNAPEVISAMELWWDELSKGSKRDQLSFNFAAWKTGFQPGIIPGNVRDNQWFYQIGIHRKNYWGKLVRYRLRKMLGLRG